MLRLPDAWLWDFWIADTGEDYHLFFLRASRALLDPHRRHQRASVGHAVSRNLRDWTLLPDALVPGDPPRWDDLATWTGSVIAGPDGVWRMFYTGISRAEQGHVQRIGVATSTDLTVWTPSNEPILTSDPRWYERRAAADGASEFWRDPWVFADPDGDGWHMLITARAPEGDRLERGVIAHAHSADLISWEVLPPTTSLRTGFGEMEVTQTEVVDGRAVLIFSCLAPQRAPGPAGEQDLGGVWAVPCESLSGPFDISRARLLLDDRFYSARLVRDRSGRWQALAFHNVEPDGSFDGRLSDPMPVHWSAAGLLQVG